MQDPIKMKYSDWIRLPRAWRAKVGQTAQVLSTRSGRSVFVPVQFVG